MSKIYILRKICEYTYFYGKNCKIVNLKQGLTKVLKTRQTFFAPNFLIN